MKDFRRIVAATDLSDCSVTALSYAKSIARKFDAELTLVHVNALSPVAESVYTHGNLAISTAYQLDSARAALSNYFAEHLSDLPGAQQVLITGAAPQTILSASRVLEADLIVMGTRGHGGFKRMVLGSVAESVVRRSDRPVLTVRCSAPEMFDTVLLGHRGERGNVSFRRILCPVDYSHASGAAFERALALASTYEAELTVLYVAEQPLSGVADAEGDEERLRAWIGDVQLPIRAKLLVHRGDAAQQVLRYARENTTDLLVVGSRPRNVANQTVLGATTDKLMRQAPCAVLTVPG